MTITPQALLAEIIKAQQEYANVYRKTLSLARYRMAVEQKLISPSDVFNEVVRESDLEHIGHVPFLAITIHPHLEHRNKVNLERALLYLAIHETPERIAGDTLHEDKTDASAEEELVAAKQLLSGVYSHYYDLYEDFHFIKNIDAQFAYSIDRIAAVIYYEMQDAQNRALRWGKLGLTLDRAREKSMKYMEWDTTMKNLFEYILNDIERQNKELSI